MNKLQTPRQKTTVETPNRLSPGRKRLERVTLVRASEALHTKKGFKKPHACPRARGRLQKGLRSPCAFPLG